MLLAVTGIPGAGVVQQRCQCIGREVFCCFPVFSEWNDCPGKRTTYFLLYRFFGFKTMWQGLVGYHRPPPPPFLSSGQIYDVAHDVKTRVRKIEHSSGLVCVLIAPWLLKSSYASNKPKLPSCSCIYFHSNCKRYSSVNGYSSVV